MKKWKVISMEERRNSDNIMRKKIKYKHIKQKIDGGLNVKFKRMEVSVRKRRMGNGNLEKIFIPLSCQNWVSQILIKSSQPLQKIRDFLERLGLTRKASQGFPLSPAVSSTLLGSSWCAQRGSKLLSQKQNDSHGKLIRIIDEETKSSSEDVIFPPSWTALKSKL